MLPGTVKKKKKEENKKQKSKRREEMVPVWVQIKKPPMELKNILTLFIIHLRKNEITHYTIQMMHMHIMKPYNDNICFIFQYILNNYF